MIAVVSLVYFAGSWVSPWRATPGQRLFGIEVARAGNVRTLALPAAMARWLVLRGAFSILAAVPLGTGATIFLASILWTLALIASMLASGRRLGLHDRIAGTWVVMPARRTTHGFALGILVVLVGIGGAYPGLSLLYFMAPTIGW